MASPLGPHARPKANPESSRALPCSSPLVLRPAGQSGATHHPTARGARLDPTMASLALSGRTLSGKCCNFNSTTTKRREPHPGYSAQGLQPAGTR